MCRPHLRGPRPACNPKNDSVHSPTATWGPELQRMRTRHCAVGVGHLSGKISKVATLLAIEMH
jgi:hypothetical protein